MDELNIVIASKNPVKRNATLSAFQKIFQEKIIKIESVNTISGVGDQPMSNRETFDGAVNRAKNATKELPSADYWVGIEGGIEKDNDEMAAFAWIYIIDKNEKWGKGKTGMFYLPKKVVALINQGMELGHADDLVFKQNNSKQQGGSVGILTKGVLGRTEYYEQAIILALIPFINEEIY